MNKLQRTGLASLLVIIALLLTGIAMGQTLSIGSMYIFAPFACISGLLVISGKG